jgi:hypothetical protein
MLFTDNTDIVSSILWTVSYLSDGHHEDITKIVNIDLMERAIFYIKKEEIFLTIPAIRICGNVFAGSNEFCDFFLQQDGLKALNKLMQTRNSSIQKECCWAVSNLAAGTEEQIQALLSDRIIDTVMQLVRESNPEVQREAIWVVCNLLTTGTQKQVELVGELGMIEMLIPHLTSFQDPSMLLLILEAITQYLHFGEPQRDDDDNLFAIRFDELGGVKALEELQTHQNITIYNHVVEMLDRFYTLEK